MSQQTFFSHIESLTSGTLCFEDPLAPLHGQARVCRYQAHRATAAQLLPDASQVQAEAFQAWLPHSTFDLSLAALDPAWSWHEVEPSIECAGMVRLRTSPRLPLQLAMPFLSDGQSAFAVEQYARLKDFKLESGQLDLRCPADEGDQLWQLQAQRDQLQAEKPRESDLGIWGNPIRSEAFKLYGLAIQHRFVGERPVVVVHDRTGEYLWGLLLAAEHYRSLHQDIPYRVALIQEQPNDHLCKAFEGQIPNWQTLSGLYAIPPEAVRDELVFGLQKLLGVAVAVPPEGNVMDEALARLSRGMVIEEEDEVVLLGP